jgi:hypothetical protein
MCNWRKLWGTAKHKFGNFPWTVSLDFLPSSFLIKQCPFGPWVTGSNRFAYGCVFAEIIFTLILEFQWCQWHCWNLRPDCHSHFCGVNDTAETITAVSMTPLKSLLWRSDKFYRDINDQIFFGSNFSGINETAETIFGVSLTPLKQFLRYQWHRRNGNYDNYV